MVFALSCNNDLFEKASKGKGKGHKTEASASKKEIEKHLELLESKKSWKLPAFLVLPAYKIVGRKMPGEAAVSEPARAGPGRRILNRKKSVSQAAEAADGNGSSGGVASEIEKAAAKEIEKHLQLFGIKDAEKDDEKDAKSAEKDDQKDTASAKNDEKDAKSVERDTESAEKVERSGDSDNEPIRPVTKEKAGNAHPALQNRVNKRKQREEK